MKFTYTNPSQIKKSGSFIKSVKGFSLVELLVVIAVIGVIAAIAIPSISGITGQAATAKAQRNAQSLSSTFASARAAGWEGTPADKAAAVTSLVTGVTGTGNFLTTEFKVPGLSSTEQTNALANLTLNGTGKTSQLEYTPPAPAQ